MIGQVRAIEIITPLQSPREYPASWMCSISNVLRLYHAAYAARRTELSSCSTNAATIPGSMPCSSRRQALPAGGNLILMCLMWA